jgi:hypothetical protein
MGLPWVVTVVCPDHFHHRFTRRATRNDQWKNRRRSCSAASRLSRPRNMMDVNAMLWLSGVVLIS